ncbi:MAG: hypothetical protein ACI8TQ_002396 [Planctomycetota bacterium]|jgi:hypothetical protein
MDPSEVERVLLTRAASSAPHLNNSLKVIWPTASRTKVMKHLRSWISLGLVTPVLLAFALPAQEIVFAPKDGLRLTKTFEFTFVSTVDDMEISMDGEPMPAPPMEMNTTQNVSVTVTDHYTKVGEGRTLILERRFDSLGGTVELDINHPMLGDMDMEAESTSELEDTTVVFTWNEEDEAYDAAYNEDSSDGDEDLLEDLSENFDMRGLLPSGAVSVDDSWPLEAEVLMSLLAPGGTLALIPQDAPAEMDMGAGIDFSTQLGNLDGDCSATFAGTKTSDEGTLAIIKLNFEVSSEKDITEQVAEATANSKQAEAMGMEQDIQSADASFEFELEGTLLWNIDGGHFHSLELTGTTEAVIDAAVSISMMGRTMDTETAMYISGELTVTTSASAAEASDE